MNEPSKTPLTDGFILSRRMSTNYLLNNYAMLADFARCIERKLAEAKAENGRLMELVIRVRKFFDFNHSFFTEDCQCSDCILHRDLRKEVDSMGTGPQTHDLTSPESQAERQVGATMLTDTEMLDWAIKNQQDFRKIHFYSSVPEKMELARIRNAIAALMASQKGGK